MNPLATRRALYRVIEPSRSRFRRKTHLLPIMLNCGCLGTRDHVPLASNALNSSNIACPHSECFKAWERREGSIWLDRVNLLARWSCLGLKMPFLDLVTTRWDGFFGPGEHEDESTWVEGDEPKVYKISWKDSMEFGNTWGGDEVGDDVGMDIGEDKFWDVVGKEETLEVEFEFWDICVVMICMWFEGVGPDGCMQVGMDVGERDVVVTAEE